MAMHAHPLPLHPYSPVHPDTSEQQVIRYPSPFIPIRLPVFALVIWLNDWVVRVINSMANGGRGGNIVEGGRGYHRSAHSVGSRSEQAEMAEAGEDLYEMKARQGTAMPRYSQWSEASPRKYE